MVPRVSVFIASSLDGFIATRDGSLAWLEAAAREDEDYGFDAFLSSVDALAMGRGTYDHIAHLDPLPFGDRPVYVFTHRPPAPRPGVTFWRESVAGAVAHWAGAGHRRVYLDGGQVISDFMAEGLVDDLLLIRVPILMGDGLPLFHDMSHPTRLRLDGVEAFASGMVSLAYSRR